MEEEQFDADNIEVKEEEEETIEEGDVESNEEGFIKGYAEDETVSECAECGAAVKEEKKVVKEFEGESYTFCSKDCAKDFEDEMG